MTSPTEHEQYAAAVAKFRRPAGAGKPDAWRHAAFATKPDVPVVNLGPPSRGRSSTEEDLEDDTEPDETPGSTPLPAFDL